MGYIGTPVQQALTKATSQYFNGTGSQTVFTLNRAVNVPEDLEVFVNNIQQEPGVGKSYTATGTTLTFDAAPSSGTGNIYVIYRGSAEVTRRLEHDPNAALAATTGTFSGNVDVTGTVTADGVHSEYNGVSDNMTTSPTASGVQIGSFTNGYSAVEIAGTAGGFIDFSSADGTDFDGRILYAHSDDAMRFNTNGSERLRIDSSGNLLVGKTSAGYNVEGISIRGDNAGVMSTVTSETPFIANRLSTDGRLMLFAKDTVGVGSIGTNGGRPYFVNPTYGGLKVGTGYSVDPANNSTGAGWDNALDLGAGGTRWKNLYLSGGVFLGGVGSANYLDDYEEGGWTPQIWKNATQVTFPTSALGQYRKIGNVIFYSFYFFKSSGSNTDNNEWTLRGMPFSMEAGGNGAYVSLTSDYTGINSVNYFNQAGSHRWQANGNAYFSLYGPQSTTQWTTGHIEFSGSGFVYAL